MYLSIPETEELFSDKAAKRGQYTAYAFAVNGVKHCSVRYSQLLALHNKLKTEFDESLLAPFPPKRLLVLNPAQVEERRQQLEQYFQKVSQAPQIIQSQAFVDFFMNAQQEVQEFCEEVTVDVYLVNGKKTSLECWSTDRTNNVLEDICKKIGLSEDLTYYFGLYLVEEKGGEQHVIRRLQDFESPYISMSRLDSNFKILLRKNYWSIDFETELMKDKIALNLLYIQGVADIKAGNLEPNEQIKAQLLKYKEQGDKAEFIKAAQAVPHYGCEFFGSVVCDWRRQGSKYRCCIGGNAIKLTSLDDKSMHVFPLTRIRCWKIAGQINERLELSFHFLRAKDDLVWVNILSLDAIFMSMSLQSMVEELIRKSKGQNIRRPRDRPPREKPAPRPRMSNPSTPSKAGRSGSSSSIPENEEASPMRRQTSAASDMGSRSQASASTEASPRRQTASSTDVSPRKQSTRLSDGNMDGEGGLGSRLKNMLGKKRDSLMPSLSDVAAGQNAIFSAEVEENNSFARGLGDDDL